MRHFILATLVLSTLAGCGVAPSPATPARAGALGARVNTTTKAAIVTVPAAVFANFEDHHAGLKKKYAGADQTLHVGVTLYASRDGFKREKLEAKLPNAQFLETGTDRAFVLGMLNGGIEPGAYTYYMVMTGVVVRQGKTRAYMDTLPDFFVSDFGKNYQATLK